MSSVRRDAPATHPAGKLHRVRRKRPRGTVALRKWRCGRLRTGVGLARALMARDGSVAVWLRPGSDP
jgi:hypothetical protein